MRLAIRNLALACCVAAWSLPVLAGSVQVPDWVKTAAAEKLPIYPADTRAIVLLEETTLNVQPDGKSVERLRRVVKILRPQGREYGEIDLPFNAESKVNFMHVWSIGPDGREYAMKDSEIVERAWQNSGILYDDVRFKTAEAPGRDVNAVIAYEYEQKVPSYFSEDTWEIQESIPKVVDRYTVHLPHGWEYKASWHGHAPVEETATPDGATWEVHDEPGLDLRDVSAAPAWRSLCARSVISYFGPGATRASGDWRSIGAYYQQLVQDRAQPNAEITAKTQELVAGKTDFADRAQAIGEYVQHTRYVGIEIGIGGWQPHAASAIFHSNSGDCKDKATLLAAMLSSVGIHSTWVMVDTRRGVVSPDLPSMFGDHMIAAIELPDGYRSDRLHSVVTAKSGKRFLIFDPTWTYTPFGTLESNLQGGYGVLVDGRQSELIALPVLAPDLSAVVRRATFKLADDGKLTGEVTESRTGDIASRRRELFQERSEKDQREEMTRALGADLGDFTLGASTAENTATLTKDFIQQFDITVPAYARQTGPLLLVRPRVFGRDAMDLDAKTRVYPVDLHGTRQVIDDFTIEMPAGWVLDELPDPVSIDLGFASYQSHTEMKGNAIHFDRTYTVSQVELPKEKYPALRSLTSQIEQDERSQVVLKKAGS